MTPEEWSAEVARRIAINEGVRTVMYRDTMGIATIGIGFNLERGDGPSMIKAIGADYGAVMEGLPISEQQAEKLFALSFAPITAAARASLESSHYDNLSDARRFVICDMVFNLGIQGWLGFGSTRKLIDQACHLNAANLHTTAHNTFGVAADHLQGSAWYAQVGDRARRNVAMLRSSGWVNAQGSGNV